jgi:hypothetical protein
MIDEDKKCKIIPSIEGLALDAYVELQEDMILLKIKMSKGGQQELWKVGLKG